METAKKNNVTVVDIARKAGVCQATVSAALHGRGRVGAVRRQQIQAIARELGYEPRPAAQLLRASRTDQLGLILAASNCDSAFVGEMPRLVLAQFVQHCMRRGLRYVIDFHHHSMDEASLEFVPPHPIAGRMVDGSVLVGDVGDALRQWLHARGTHPWVSIEEPADYCVLSAADDGVAAAVRMLLELGHRRLAYCGGPQRYSQQQLGLQAFKSTVIGLAPAIQEFPPDLTAENIAAVHQWGRDVLRRSRRPTALVCHGECLARAVIYAAAELGLDVPRDLSVVSYGSVAEAERRYPRLTTIENDYAEITLQAMSLLELQLSKQPIDRPRRRVTPRLIPGNTVAAAPAEVRSVRE